MPRSAALCDVIVRITESTSRFRTLSLAISQMDPLPRRGAHRLEPLDALAVRLAGVAVGAQRLQIGLAVGAAAPERLDVVDLVRRRQRGTANTAPPRLLVGHGLAERGRRAGTGECPWGAAITTPRRRIL